MASLSRPALQGANASTQSLPLISSSDDARNRPSLSTARYAAINAASASGQSSPLHMTTSLPRSNAVQQQRSYFDGNVGPTLPASAPVEMMRTNSSDSQRSLRFKTSRKDLKETASRSTPSAQKMGKQKTSGKSVDHDIDDDARSIDSFCCSYGNEFDRQRRARKVSMRQEDPKSRQRWLDAAFRKLTQKAGAGFRRANQPLQEGERRKQDVLHKASKSETHFLDFTAIISPLPCSEGLTVPPQTSSGSTNVTPRPQDYSRFTPSPVPNSSGDATKTAQTPLLRPRRSEESLMASRRAQKQQVIVQSSADGEMGLGSHPVPRLPDWARTENKSLHQHNRSADMARSISHDVESSTLRETMLARANSHNVSALHLALMPMPMSARTESFPLSPVHSAPRSQSSMEHRDSRPVIPPLAFQDSIATRAVLQAGINRGSISSVTSDSDISSSISSVPQTPVSRFNTLASMPMIRRQSHSTSVYYDFDPILEAPGQQGEEEGECDTDVRARWIEHNSSPVKQHASAPKAYFMNPSSNRSVPHVASIFANENAVIDLDATAMARSRSSGSSGGGASGTTGSDSHRKMRTGMHATSLSFSSISEGDGNDTIRVGGTGKMNARPRAATLSSSSKPMVAGSTRQAQVPTDYGKSKERKLPVSPKRTSSLSHNRNGSGSSKRTSVSSTATSASSASSSSGASALLSYMRNHSKSQTNLAILREASQLSDSNSVNLPAPSSSGTINVCSSSLKRGGMSHDEIANSHGQRLGRSIVASAAAAAGKSQVV